MLYKLSHNKIELVIMQKLITVHDICISDLLKDSHFIHNALLFAWNMINFTFLNQFNCTLKAMFPMYSFSHLPISSLTNALSNLVFINDIRYKSKRMWH